MLTLLLYTALSTLYALLLKRNWTHERSVSHIGMVPTGRVYSSEDLYEYACEYTHHETTYTVLPRASHNMSMMHAASHNVIKGRRYGKKR